jgi:predicted ABC-type ATPase
LNAANKAQSIRLNCLAAGRDMAFETVFSSPEKVDFVRSAKLAGFFVRLFFVCTNDPSINAQRVALRVMEGGHDVPIPKIIGRYYKSIANCVESLPYVDRAYFYDNSEQDEDPRLLFKVAEGRVAKIYGDMSPWSETIFNVLNASV